MKLKHIPLLLLVLTCCPACQNKKASAAKEIPRLWVLTILQIKYVLGRTETRPAQV